MSAVGVTTRTTKQAQACTHMTTGACIHVDTCTHVHAYMPSGCVPCLPLENPSGSGFKELCLKDRHTAQKDIHSSYFHWKDAGIRAFPGPTEDKWRRDVVSRHRRLWTAGLYKSLGWHLPCCVMPAL